MNKLYSFLISLIILFIFGYVLFDFETLYKFYAEHAYFFPFFTVLIWTQVIVQNLEWKKLCSLFQENKIAIIISILITSSLYISFGVQPKILTDELHYSSISKSMYEHHNVYNVTEEESKYPELKIRLASDLGGRTLVYPFFVSILHTFFRYNYYNHYVLNYFSTILCLMLIYYIITQIFEKKIGIISIFVCISFPIFIQNATSSSIEMFNLLFCLLIVLFAYKLSLNKDVYTAELLLYTSLIYINIKQNNIYIFIAICCYAAFILKSKIQEFSYRTTILPIFLIPYLWMNSLLEGNEELNFGNILHFPINNFKNACVIIFGINDNYGWMFLPTVIIALFPILLLCKYIFFKKESSIKQKHSNKLFFTFFILFHIILLSDNINTLPNNASANYISRASFVLIFLFIVCIAYIYSFFSKYTFLNKKMIMIITCCIVLYNSCYGVTRKGIEKELSFKEIRSILSFLETEFPYKEDYMLISPFPSFFIPHNYDSISIKRFNLNSASIIEKKEQNKGMNLLIIQELQNGKVLDNSLLSSNQSLKILYEKSVIEGRTVRISQVNLNYK